MPSAFTQLYLHCVWSTWDRLGLLTPEVEHALYTSIHEKCQSLNCRVVALGGVADHIHLLVELHPTVCVADLVKEVKGASSHLMTHVIRPGEFFKWQGSYSAFTLSRADLPGLQEYIACQKQHHAENELFIEYEPLLPPGI